LSSADILRTREILQMRTSALSGAINIRFFEIYGVSARIGVGVSQCGQFAEKGMGGLFFVILCGRPLWTASNALPELVC